MKNITNLRDKAFLHSYWSLAQMPWQMVTIFSVPNQLTGLKSTEQKEELDKSSTVQSKNSVHTNAFITYRYSVVVWNSIFFISTPANAATINISRGSMSLRKNPTLFFGPRMDTIANAFYSGIKRRLSKLSLKDFLWSVNNRVHEKQKLFNLFWAQSALSFRSEQ